LPAGRIFFRQLRRIFYFPNSKDYQTTMLQPGQSYRYAFSFNQADVEAFARLTGDTNPLHLDAEYAAHTAFRRPIMHGLLGASVFSKVLGTIFPGEGTVYLKHEIEFTQPMYVDVPYEAVVTIKELGEKFTAKIETLILEKETGKVTINGEALVMNRQKVPRIKV
jgi:acyl dehydratase